MAASKPDPADKLSAGGHGAPPGGRGVGSVGTCKRGLRAWQSATLQTDVSESHVAKPGEPAPGSPSATQLGFGEGGDPNGSFSSPCRSCSHDGRSTQLPRKGTLQAVLPSERGAPHPPQAGMSSQMHSVEFHQQMVPKLFGGGGGVHRVT